MENFNDDLTFKLIEANIIENENKELRNIFEENKVSSDLSRWANIGLLEGIEDERDRKVLAILFEESLKMMVDGQIRDEGQMETAYFPILRRIFIAGKINSYFTKSTSFIKIRKKSYVFIAALAKNVRQYLISPPTNSRINELQAFNNIDLESEIIYEYAENFDFSILVEDIKVMTRLYKSRDKRFQNLLKQAIASKLKN